MRGNTAPYQAVGGYPLPLGFNGRLAWIYRWFSGRPLNGHRYTDATGFKYGTMALDVSGHATSYQLLPGYLRFLYARLPIMLAVPAALATLLWPMVMYYVAMGLILVATWRVDRWRKRAAFRRDVIEPVSAGVSAVLRSKRVAGQGHLMVAIPEDFRDNPESKITVKLPLDWIGQDGDKTALVKVVAAKLNMDELTPQWSLHGSSPAVSLVQPPKPPDMVSWLDAAADVDSLDDMSIMVGHGPRSVPVIFSLILDSPHMLIAGGAGAGKSVLLAWMVGQFMRRGAGVIVLDAKFVSHLWLGRVPGVFYASENAEMHDALIWLDEEIMRRARLVKNAPDPEAASAALPRLVAVLEEMTAARNRLDGYWKSIKGPGDPAMSPALRALGNVANMGRELRVYVLSAGQSMTAKSTGGPEGRESFGARALARATANQWKMLAPQIKPAPIKRNKPGRWHLVIGDTLHEFQVPRLDLKDTTAMAAFIEWATSGAPVPDVPAMMAGWSADETTTEIPEMPSSEVVTSLRDYAVNRGVSLPSLRQWVNRYAAAEGLQPASTGPNRTALYAWEDLDAFVARRMREPVE